MAEHSMCHPGRPWGANNPMTSRPDLQGSIYSNVHGPQNLSLTGTLGEPCSAKPPPPQTLWRLRLC